MTTPTSPAHPRSDGGELFDRARDWVFNQGESGWVSDAFGHWVITEIAPRRPVPERLTELWVAWNYDPVPRIYRARHGARLSGSAPWRPGDPLPSPPSTGPAHADGSAA